MSTVCAGLRNACSRRHISVAGAGQLSGMWKTLVDFLPAWTKELPVTLALEVASVLLMAEDIVPSWTPCWTSRSGSGRLRQFFHGFTFLFFCWVKLDLFRGLQRHAVLSRSMRVHGKVNKA